MAAAPEEAEAGVFSQGIKKALDMSKKARMQRARDMGFDTDTPLYHGTVDDFSSFSRDQRGKVAPSMSSKRATWAASDPDVAEGYMNLAEGGGVQRLIDESGAAERAGDWDLSHDLMAEAERLEQAGIVTEGGNIMPIRAPKNALPFNAEGQRYSADDYILMDKVNEAQRGDYDAVRIDEFVDNADWSNHIEATHMGIFDPTNIRSKFARFDPRLKHLANLSAGVGGVSLGATLGLNDEQKLKDYLNNL
jgi:hypothetical protein